MATYAEVSTVVERSFPFADAASEHMSYEEFIRQFQQKNNVVSNQKCDERLLQYLDENSMLLCDLTSCLKEKWEADGFLTNASFVDVINILKKTMFVREIEFDSEDESYCSDYEFDDE